MYLGDRQHDQAAHLQGKIPQSYYVSTFPGVRGVWQISRTTSFRSWGNASFDCGDTLSKQKVASMHKR